jgi:signal transduction histidine kinase
MSALISRVFARKMAPLAIVAGALVATIPPLAYRLIAWHQLEAQARLYAVQMAGTVARAIEEEPWLLRYSAPKIIGAVAGYRGQSDLARVTIVDCAGAALVSSAELGLGTGSAAGPAASAPVRRGAGALALIEVAMDTRAQRGLLGGLAAVAGVVGATLALLLFLFPVRTVRAQERRLAELLAALAERELSRRLLALQEEERRRIARDLHDGVGQALTALQIALELAERRPAEASSHLASARRLAEEVLSEIRAAVFALRPSGLAAEGGLDVALRACVERFELRSRVPASLRCEGSLASVPEDAALALLRILQEALTNVSRHASAHEVGVLVQSSATSIRLEVSDDGRGLPEGYAARGGFGLRGIEERASLLGGTVRIEGREGEGTRVAVELPLPPREGGDAG